MSLSRGVRRKLLHPRGWWIYAAVRLLPRSLGHQRGKSGASPGAAVTPGYASFVRSDAGLAPSHAVALSAIEGDVSVRQERNQEGDLEALG